MSDFQKYRRKGLAEMRSYVEVEDPKGVSISDTDICDGSPKIGDMIARNPSDSTDRWLVAKDYFEANFEIV
ncbi:MAG: hypothetical protein ACI8ZN_001761 [Bacteroidia bacterium]|jgi:hypothetical protein